MTVEFLGGLQEILQGFLPLLHLLILKKINSEVSWSLARACHVTNLSLQLLVLNPQVEFLLVQLPKPF